MATSTTEVSVHEPDTYAQPLPGVRIYRYRINDAHRVAIHLPAGANALDLNIDEARHLAEELTELSR